MLFKGFIHNLVVDGVIKDDTNLGREIIKIIVTRFLCHELFTLSHNFYFLVNGHSPGEVGIITVPSRQMRKQF